eukprot:scaffold11756_cov42-Cyclotella_meneghiniana.AAC.1
MALAFRPKVICRLLQVGRTLVCSLGGDGGCYATKSSQSTPPKVAETFVMVLVGCSDDWAAIRRLPAMVGVVEVSSEVIGCFCVRVEGGRDSRRLSLAICARAHERGFSCPS